MAEDREFALEIERAKVRCDMSGHRAEQDGDISDEREEAADKAREQNTGQDCEATHTHTHTQRCTRA